MGQVKGEHMSDSRAVAQADADLQQHFQNYFELLLGAERATLRNAIEVEHVELDNDSLIHHVEQRIAYLKGAARMGKLLCLIGADDAKLMHDILKSEQADLVARCRSRRHITSAT